MGTVAVDVQAVSKRFRLYHEKYTSLKEKVIHAGKVPYEDLWALRDVGFTVEEDYLDGGVNGDCSHEKHRIRVEVRNEPKQQVKTLAHELAHAILHEAHDLPRERMELEAESVAFIVCADMHIDTAAYSVGYVATWAGGGDEARKALVESAQRIQKAAHLILDGGRESSEEEAA